MKAEEFDQYVRAQFENEAVAPRAEVEDAVFASLSAATRKRRGIAAACGSMHLLLDLHSLMHLHPLKLLPLLL
ncbi:MAG: hypothetical protein ACPF91_03070 [Flavobacteriales bacterium]